MYLNFLKNFSVELKEKFAYLKSFNRKLKKDVFMDQMKFMLYEKINKLPDVAVVELFVSYGQGDIHNALKTANILLSINQITYVSVSCHDTCKELVLTIAEQYGLQDIVFNRSELNEKITDKTNVVVFQIAVPDYKQTVKGNCTYVYVDEYNGERFKYNCKYNKNTSLTKKNNIVYWLCGGIGISEGGLVTSGLTFGSNEIGLEINNLAFYTFQISSAKIYFAYNSDSCDFDSNDPRRYTLSHLKRYILSIVEMNKNCDQKIIFLILGISSERFIQMGIHEIMDQREIEFYPGYQTHEFNYKGKPIQFRFLNTVNHDTMLYCIKNSQEPVYITGDQSLTEAIDFDKLFFYQLMYWKTKLYDDYCKFIEFNVGKKEEPVIGNKRKRSYIEHVTNAASKRMRWEKSHYITHHVFEAHEMIDTSPLLAYHRLVIGKGTFTNYTSDRRVYDEAKEIGCILRTHMDQIQKEKAIVYKKIKKYYDMKRTYNSILNFVMNKNIRINQLTINIMNKLMEEEPDFEKIEKEFIYLEQKLTR